MSDKTYRRVGFICRGQGVHNGHIKMVRKGLEQANQVVVLVGSAYASPKPTYNPFSYDERVNMFKGSFTASELNRVKFEPLRDDLYNNPRWQAEVQRIMSKGMTSDDKIAIISSNKGEDAKMRKDWFPYWDHITEPATVGLDATKIRQMMYAGEFNANNNWVKSNVPENVVKQIEDFMQTEKFDWLKEYYDFAQAYKKPYEDAVKSGVISHGVKHQTADSVVICAGHILLVQRKIQPGKDLWALPGGHINMEETALEAALRELDEETSIDIPPRVLRSSIVADEPFDHPQRSELGRVFTNAYCIYLPAQISFDNKHVRNEGGLPRVKAKDDAKDAKWVPLHEFYGMSEVLFDDHYHIGCFFLNSINSSKYF